MTRNTPRKYEESNVFAGSRSDVPDSLLSHALTEDENLLLRQTLGMGCKQRSVKSLAQQMGTTQKAVQKKLVSIVEKLRHHDESILLWKYLNR